MHCLSLQSLFWKLRKSNLKFNCAKVILTKCFTKNTIIIITEKGIFFINLQEVASENWKQSHGEECEHNPK